MMYNNLMCVIVKMQIDSYTERGEGHFIWYILDMIFSLDMNFSYFENNMDFLINYLLSIKFRLIVVIHYKNIKYENLCKSIMKLW